MIEELVKCVPSHNKNIAYNILYFLPINLLKQNLHYKL